MRFSPTGRAQSIVAILAIVACQPAVAAGGAADRDSGWRRTAFGWEQSAEWSAPRTASLQLPNDDSNHAVARHDFHPTLLILLQLSLALGGMYVGARLEPPSILRRDDAVSVSHVPNAENSSPHS